MLNTITYRISDAIFPKSSLMILTEILNILNASELRKGRTKIATE